MAVDNFEAPYGLVFHFDCYTGGFERQFCAYVVGAVGECDVGREMLSLYKEDHPKGTQFYGLIDRTQHEPDDHGCHRPVSIYHDLEVDKAPYNSVIIFFSTIPEEEEIQMMLARANDFAKNRPDWRSRSEKTPLTLFGAKLISNKVKRVIKTEEIFVL